MEPLSPESTFPTYLAIRGTHYVALRGALTLAGLRLMGYLHEAVPWPSPGHVQVGGSCRRSGRGIDHACTRAARALRAEARPMNTATYECQSGTRREQRSISNVSAEASDHFRLQTSDSQTPQTSIVMYVCAALL
jgi:hypothetical protein